MYRTMRLVLGFAAAAILLFAGCTNPVGPAPAPTPPAVPVVETPVFTPEPGSYSVDELISISCVTTDAEIYYTTDGSEPTDASTLYSGPFTIVENVKAIAVKDGYDDSAVANADYTLVPYQTASPGADIVTGEYYDVLSVSLTCPTSGSTIYYTTDGNDPTTSSSTFSTAIPVTETTVIKAFAQSPDSSWDPSAITVFSYTLIASDVVFDVAGGDYSSEQTVMLSSDTPDGTIRFTTDGTDPSVTNGSDYIDPITVDVSGEIRAASFRSGWTDSAVSSEIYNLNVSDPSISLASGTYYSEQVASISYEAGSSVRYTLDGSDPSASNGTLYSGGNITIDQSGELRAVAYRSGWTSSAISSENYVLAVTAPSIVLAGGSYLTEQSTVISYPSGSSVRYTLDGSTPSATNGTLYSGGDISIDGDTDVTLKAVAFRSGWTTSSAVSTSYSIALPSTRSFFAQNIETDTQYSVPTTRLAYSDHLVVYAEGGHGLTSTDGEGITAEFEANIYNLIRTNYAVESDVDGNGRIIVFLLDIQDGYSGSGGYVAGYFSPHDTIAASDSNEADMLYMDVYPAVAGSSEFYATIAHEFQHLVNFNTTYILGGGKLQDTWINEGLSSGAEYLYQGSQVTSRIDYYNADPAGTITQGNNFFIWNGYYEQATGDVLADYATVYLFFQWLQIQASNGTGIYKDILDTGLTDYEAVLTAAETDISEYGGSTFWSTLLSDWMLANILNETSGIHGYASQIATTPGGYGSTGGSTYILSPGERIFIQTDASGSFSPVSAPVGSRYIGITFSDNSLDYLSPYDGDVVLIYNSYSVTDEYYTVEAPIPSYENGAPLPLLSTSSTSAALPESYPVGVEMINPLSGAGVRMEGSGSAVPGSRRTTK